LRAVLLISFQSGLACREKPGALLTVSPQGGPHLSQCSMSLIYPHHHPRYGTTATSPGLLLRYLLTGYCTCVLDPVVCTAPFPPALPVTHKLSHFITLSPDLTITPVTAGPRLLTLVLVPSHYMHSSYITNSPFSHPNAHSHTCLIDPPAPPAARSHAFPFHCALGSCPTHLPAPAPYLTCLFHSVLRTATHSSLAVP